MKIFLALCSVIFFSLQTVAQHSHGDKGPNGGPMQDVAGVHVELITSGNTLTINVFNEGNKPISVKNYSASALIVVGSDRETITLQLSGDNALKGEAKKPIIKGATITILIKTSAGDSGQARFKL